MEPSKQGWISNLEDRKQHPSAVQTSASAGNVTCVSLPSRTVGSWQLQTGLVTSIYQVLDSLSSGFQHLFPLDLKLSQRWAQVKTELWERHIKGAQCLLSLMSCTILPVAFSPVEPWGLRRQWDMLHIFKLQATQFLAMLLSRVIE